ncbi:hypothetical protein [Mycoplasmopsis opalescens]|uniref:hypothetical protein n=1 Tax=Mycoplasmopsis opalescens TaxID=114886 RepID=UPI0004A6D295|nr:hypothetical protein [Mycoplasmopsis opalescens]
MWLYNLFNLNNDSKGTVALVFGVIAIFTTAFIGLPQLIVLLKNKKTSANTPYYSYWIFYVGLIGWIFIGSYDYSDPKLLASAYTNIIAGLIYTLTMIFLYRYSTGKRRKFWYIPLIITVAITLTSSILAIIGIVYEFHMNEKIFTVVIQIVPVVTTLSFFPHLIKGFQNKKFDGISEWMCGLFITTNVFWNCYWFSMVAIKGLTPALISTIIWQTFSLLIYASILFGIIKYQPKKHKSLKK